MKQSTPIMQHEVIENIDSTTFRRKQRLGFKIVKHRFNSNAPKEQLLLIVVGEGGTGKSYLIKAIRNFLQSRCAIAAPTGKAAFNIGGVTLHSLLQLPIKGRNLSDLKGRRLIKLQETLGNVDYIIIDEYSVLWQATLALIDKRCREASGLHSETFGDKSIILISDQGQLPPVGDKPLYHCKPVTELCERGFLLYV